MALSAAVPSDPWDDFLLQLHPHLLLSTLGLLSHYYAVYQDGSTEPFGQMDSPVINPSSHQATPNQWSTEANTPSMILCIMQSEAHSWRVPWEGESQCP